MSELSFNQSSLSTKSGQQIPRKCPSESHDQIYILCFYPKLRNYFQTHHSNWCAHKRSPKSSFTNGTQKSLCSEGLNIRLTVKNFEINAEKWNCSRLIALTLVDHVTALERECRMWILFNLSNSITYDNQRLLVFPCPKTWIKIIGENFI